MRATHVFSITSLWLLVPLVTGQARADVLVEYTFGNSPNTATEMPQSVSANLLSTPMIGRQGQSLIVVPHYFTEWSPGNMAMTMTNAQGPPIWGRLFEFTLQAEPGFTFQLTDASLTWGAWNTYGVSTDVSVWPNQESMVGLASWSGGDFSTTLDPGSPLWRITEWNALAARTDLTSLMMRVFLITSGGPYTTSLDHLRISGNVYPVPSPATLGLLAFGGTIGVLRRRR